MTGLAIGDFVAVVVITLAAQLIAPHISTRIIEIMIVIGGIWLLGVIQANKGLTAEQRKREERPALIILALMCAAVAVAISGM